MRIGLISSPWFAVPPTAYGGIERVVNSLARGFADAGEEVVLAAPSDSTCPVPLAPGMRAADSRELGMRGSEMNHAIRAYDAMGQVDVIHDHTLTGPLYAHRPRVVPVVTTIHGRLLPEVAEIYRAMSRDTSILGISYDQVHQAPDVPVARVIHHGMDLADVPVGSGRGGYACFVGRMCPDKGALEAVEIAHAAGIPLRLAAKVQEAPELEYFHDVVEPVLGPDDEFVGEIGEPDKYYLMGESLALLNPIQWPEPFGLVMIEALATGTPVITTRAGAAPEIVDDGVTGYLASVEDLPGLLLMAGELDRAECRKIASQRFSAGRMVADHLDFYRELLNR
ncbi:glycosyltransferase family 4 protein [Arthrobacter sp. FW306-05-C]|nr:glycosyltransferase family 4 protein [Arthrobacter sp. FW306-05-C]UKA68487.1 glycosyltransferase family 4 protein [Arthrobacter sp. FW306-05-C]